jgi:hypothetical protein
LVDHLELEPADPALAPISGLRRLHTRDGEQVAAELARLVDVRGHVPSRISPTIRSTHDDLPQPQSIVGFRLNVGGGVFMRLDPGGLADDNRSAPAGDLYQSPRAQEAHGSMSRACGHVESRHERLVRG